MSEIKVNKITPRAACGTTQLGDSGDTFTVPAGATIQNLGTATGFGGTGVVSWDTSSIKTTAFAAITGTGYFCNTTAGGFNVTLPLSPNPGDVIGVADYAKTFDTDNLTLLRNGENIGGTAVNATLNTEGIAVTLVYVDSTKGWIVTDSGNQSDTPTAEYVSATGGNTTLTVGNYKTHIFTSPGTLCVSSSGNACGSNSVDYLVVAGGGSAGGYYGAGGAGGLRLSNVNALAGMPPLANPTGAPVAVAPYPVSVGGGGAANPSAPGIGPYDGNVGVASSLAVGTTITSAGGGYGAASGCAVVGGSGGSGGASGYFRPPAGQGQGNTPPVSPPQGNPAGRASYATAGGGGGAGAAGSNGTCNGLSVCAPQGGPQVGGDGGVGAYVADGFIGPTAPSYGTPGPAGSSRYFAGGGAGGSCSGTAGSGGAGGGGAGRNNSGPFCAAQNGDTNTGGGGGASGGGVGGPGIVIVRYKYQ